MNIHFMKALLMAVAVLAAPLTAHALTNYVEQEALQGNSQYVDFAEYAGALSANDSIVITGYFGSTAGGTISPDYFSFSGLAGQNVQVSLLTQDASNNASLGIFKDLTLLNFASENNTSTNPPLTFTQSLSIAYDYVVGVGGYSAQSPGGFDHSGGTSGWTYQLTITAMAQPVPEPEPVTLLLAGLGAIGLMSRRRKRS